MKAKKTDVSAESGIEPILAEGKTVLIRTVTMAHLGRVVSIGDRYITLAGGGWLADTGRFSEALTSGKVSEFERAPGPFLVATGAIVDIWPWSHAVPASTP